MLEPQDYERAVQSPQREHDQARCLLCVIPYAETRVKCERLKVGFASWCAERGYQAAAEMPDRDWERMVAFYEFPQEHWHHHRSTNIVESPFAALRLRTDAAKRY